MEDPDDRKVKLMHLGRRLAGVVEEGGYDVGYDYLIKHLVPRYKLTEREQFAVVFRAGVLCECKSWEKDAK